MKSYVWHLEGDDFPAWYAFFRGLISVLRLTMQNGFRKALLVTSICNKADSMALQLLSLF